MAKQRSPNYPSIGLADAVDAVHSLYDKEKRTPVPGIVAAKAIGYQSMSGPARVKLAALKKYGLIEGDERSGIRVSELALRIMFPADAEAERQARKEAALKPELFQTLNESYRDASDDAIRSYLITKLHFAPIGAKQVIASFRDTLSFAALNIPDYNVSDMSGKNEALSTAPRPTFDNFDWGSTNRPTTPKPAAAAKVFTWPLSKGVTAEVRFTGGEVQESHIDLLTKYLELAKMALGTSDKPDEVFNP
jgi:hypothetical protein